MKILITGQTSSQIHETTKRSGLTLSGALAQSLRKQGHDVTVRPYTIAESLDAGNEDIFDHVIVGLGPLKGLGTSYLYGALQCIYDYDVATPGEQRLTLFTDDISTRKIGSEHLAITRKPSDLTKPFFSYKKEHALASEPSTTDKLLTVVAHLTGRTDWEHAPMLMPTWSQDLGFSACLGISRECGDAMVPFDPTRYFGHDIRKMASTHEKSYWSTNWKTDSPAINKMGVNDWDVLHNSRASWNVLAGSQGVLIPSAAWAPELGIAAALGIPTAADWRTLGPALGACFEELPMNIEIMPEKDRTELAKAQYDTIQKQNELLGNCDDVIAATVERGTR